MRAYLNAVCFNEQSENEAEHNYAVLSKHEKLTQCFLILVHHIRRRPNIKTIFGQYLVFAGWHHTTSDFTRIASQQTQKYLHNICTTSAQRFRRWPNIVHMLYKCFVFAGFLSNRKHSINVIRILSHRLRR